MTLLKNIEMPIGKGLLFSIIAIVIVFVILAVIIICVEALSKIKFKEEVKPAAKPASVAQASKKLTMEDIKDEDMMVAALVATAEFVDETKEKDARLVSIKQIG